MIAAERQRRPGHLARLAGPLLSLAVALAGCSGGTGARDGSSTYVAASERITVFVAADRKPAPALAAATLDGKRFDLAAQRGKVVVINVWSTTCPPCRKETPALSRVATATAALGVRFVGIATRDELPQAREFVRRYRVSYPSLADPDGDLVVRFRGTVPTTALPSTLVIDRQGRIAARALGAVTEQEIRRMLDPVVAEPA